MNKNSFIFDKLVIGNNLEAVLCCFYNKLNLIYTRNSIPDESDIIQNYGLGSSRRDIWLNHTFQLSVAGYIPFQDKVLHIVYLDKETLKIVTKEENIYYIKFKELYVFDDFNILNLPVDLKRASENVRMIDTFKSTEGNVEELESIESKTKFMNHIILKNNMVKVISYVKKEDIDKYEAFLVKIKVENILSSVDNEIELEHSNREIYDLEKNVYEDFDNVTFSYADDKLMYEIRKKHVKIDYMKYFRMKLGISND